MNTATIRYGQIGTLFFSLILLLSFITPSLSFAEQKQPNKTLVIYYSHTGNTKATCDALQKKISADVLEIKDLKNNPGKLTKKTDKKLNLVMDTEIEPTTVDLSRYSSVILASPIWMATLSPAIRTFLTLNKLDGKKVLLFTTTNARLNEQLQEKITMLVKQAGGEVVGYYQVLAMEEKDGKKAERTLEQMVEDTLQLVPEMQNALSSPLN